MIALMTHHSDVQHDLCQLRATQIAARFISHHGPVMPGNRRIIPATTLLALMYLLERYALANWGHLICADAFVSSKNGPISAYIEQLTRSRNTYWASHIATNAHGTLALIASPGVNQLSEAIELRIDRLCEEHAYRKPADLIAFTKALPEWTNPGKDAQTPINLVTILEAAGQTPENTACIIAEIRALERMHALLS